MAAEIKPGQIWRRKTDGTLVEVKRVYYPFGIFTKTGARHDVSYRRLGVKGIGWSQCYEDNFFKRYELIEEVES